MDDTRQVLLENFDEEVASGFVYTETKHLRASENVNAGCSISPVVNSTETLRLIPMSLDFTTMVRLLSEVIITSTGKRRTKMEMPFIGWGIHLLRLLRNEPFSGTLNPPASLSTTQPMDLS